VQALVEELVSPSQPIHPLIIVTEAASHQPTPSRKRARTLCFPQQSLAKSSFLRLYGEAAKRPSADECHSASLGVPGLEKTAAELCKLMAQNDKALETYAVKLWARLPGTEGGDYFYKLLNDAVIADDPVRLRPLIPLARVLNNVLNEYRPRSEVKTYRGSRLSLEQFEAIQVGHFYRVAMFVASSERRNVAERFLEHREGDFQVLVEISIPQGCFNAGFLGVEFWKENEHEYLTPPYTVVEIVEKKQAACSPILPSGRGVGLQKSKARRCSGKATLVVRVAKDNMKHRLDLASILL